MRFSHNRDRMLQHWQECRKNFQEQNSEQNRLLWVQWDPLRDTWTFRGPGAGDEPEKIFKSLANMAARGLPDSQSRSDGERWKNWLDVLRNEGRKL